MKIYNFSQLGSRGNNEDCLGTNDALLTVCDGMGGHNYGERASSFVVEQMLKHFNSLSDIGKTDIQHYLDIVQSDLYKLLDDEPELENMGTTFTGIFRTRDVWFAAHIGDSRIYLFRPSERKLWHTWDHSLVGELMRTKEITVEAGRFHPMSNRISNAIIAQKNRKLAKASIVKIDELKAGDILFLCSDGVIEAWSDRDLVRLFSDAGTSFDEKCATIAKRCNEESKDNNTAIIVEIERNDEFSYGNNEELEWTLFGEVEADYEQFVKDTSDSADLVAELDEAPYDKAATNPSDSKSGKNADVPSATQSVSFGKTNNNHHRSSPVIRKYRIFIILFIIVGLCLGSFFFLKSHSNENQEKKIPQTTKIESRQAKKYKKEASKTDAKRNVKANDKETATKEKTVKEQSPKSNTTTPEVKKTGDSEQTVKEQSPKSNTTTPEVKKTGDSEQTVKEQSPKSNTTTSEVKKTGDLKGKTPHK